MTLSLRIDIRSIPHAHQRYNTCGDWYTFKDGGMETMKIFVSSLPTREEMYLIAIHELIEAFLCECRGITQTEVDRFDKDFESKRCRGDSDLSMNPCEEPGDDPSAPYYKQHQFATGIERILAAEARVSWLEYEQHINELDNKGD